MLTAEAAALINVDFTPVDLVVATTSGKLLLLRREDGPTLSLTVVPAAGRADAETPA